MYKGIDVSNHNGHINWEEVKNNIDFAIIRLGWGSNIASQDDPEAIYNMQECERLGIPYGIYLYSYALNNSEAESEAAHALRMVQGHNPALGIWFDMEDADAYKERHGINVYNSRELLTGFCKIFCNAILQAGFKTGVYANKNYFDSVLLADELHNYDKWLAHWGISEPSMPCLIWQYTSDGAVDGVPSARVDLNYYYGELPQEDVPEQEQDTPEPDPEDTAYHVGDCVIFNTIYESSTSTDALNPLYTSGEITNVILGAANPYLIGGGTGWINDECIVSGEVSEPEEETVITVGTQVCVKDGAKDVNGTQLADFVYLNDYDVLTVGDGQAVIGKSGAVTARMRIDDLYMS